MNPKRTILLLIIILLIVILFSYQRGNQKRKTSVVTVGTMHDRPTNPPFISNIYERFVYYHDKNLYEMKLPELNVVQIAAKSETIIHDFFPIKPSWSSDGSLFAFAVDSRTIIISSYQTGTKVSTIHLNSSLDHTSSFTFSPDQNVLSVNSGNLGSPLLSFYAIATGNSIGSVNDCDTHNFWISNSGGYVVTCKNLNGYSSIYVIDIQDSMLHKRQILESTGSIRYVLINVYDRDRFVVEMVQGNKKSEIAVDKDGKITEIPSKTFITHPVDDFIDPEKTLAMRIEKSKNTEPIDDLSVSSDNQWVLFHTKSGIWIVDIKLENSPYFITSGSFPIFRP